MTENELLSTVKGAISRAKYSMNNGIVHPDDEAALKQTSESIEAKIKTLEEAKSHIDGFFLVSSGENLYS